ncbi:MAG: MOSC domain-containing protein [Alphaproteobacteria bacterium]
MHVGSLHIYPLKGARAVDLGRSAVGARGLDGDRRWLAVNAAGRQMTQRSHPSFATITARPHPAGLGLSAGGKRDLLVPAPAPDAERIDATVWEDVRVSAALAFAGAHEWISAVAGEPARLVHFDARSERLKRGIWVSAPLPMGFADAYPILVATTGSLAALNAEIARGGGAPVPMRRFRPNIVVDCDDPWAEDFWKTLRIGGNVFDLVKPDDRCVVTTTDQETGRRMGKEPLASLARIRRSADPRINGVIFGWYAVPRGP